MNDESTDTVEALKDGLRSEHDAPHLGELLKDGIRGKYIQRYRQGTNVVRLALDVAVAFPTEQAVNRR